MKLLRAMFLALMASAALFAQGQPDGNGTTDNSSSIAEQIKVLQATMAAQRKQIEQLQYGASATEGVQRQSNGRISENEQHR
jgi:hypothetical protein